MNLGDGEKLFGVGDFRKGMEGAGYGGGSPESIFLYNFHTHTYTSSSTRPDYAI